MMHRHIRILIGATLSLLLWGCGGDDAAHQGNVGPRIAVRSFEVRESAAGASEAVPGSVRPRLRASIEAKISGTIDRIPVREGDAVEEGQLLAELNVQEIKAKLDQANAMKEQAERDLVRFEALLRQNALTRQEYDAIEAKTRVARAAALEAQTMLGYAKVSAPFRGIITRKLANVGDLASPGRPLFEIEDPATLRFEAAVPESLIDGLHAGDRVRIAIGERESAGSIAEIAPTADPNSRTFLVKFDLASAEGLRSGQYGHVEVAAGGEKSLFVPSGALQTRGQMEMLYVIRDGSVAMRLVRSGRRLPGQIEILSGLQPGETIAVEAASPLRDGAPIEVRP